MILNINIPFMTGTLTGTVECNLDYHILASEEETYGAYRRVEHVLEITHFEYIRLDELIWETDDGELHIIDYGPDVNDADDKELVRRWNRQLAAQDQDFWLDTDMIIYENPDLWIED